jgi:hypothetical protein|tara:strand:+ start:5536 stop:5916 length:381 start_codon:yes stop_codon:yes gene_type:complete
MSNKEEISGLTFDWDNISFDDERVQKELSQLSKEFGKEFIWYRESSSNSGLHVIVAELSFDKVIGDFILVPLPFSFEQQMEYRNQTDLECRGRNFSDLIRKDFGLRTSRIFSIKNGLSVSEWKRFK